MFPSEYIRIPYLTEYKRQARGARDSRASILFWAKNEKVERADLRTGSSLSHTSENSERPMELLPLQKVEENTFSRA